MIPTIHQLYTTQHPFLALQQQKKKKAIYTHIYILETYDMYYNLFFVICSVVFSLSTNSINTIHSGKW